ncbi:MAG: response regulator [Dehalococcoidia bacterium]|nr:MAG: response regulator [Dehalococcoidia bacterium]
MTNDKMGSVLIVDDEAVICKLLNLRLSQGGYTCYEASNTAQASILLQKHPITLVLLDINMPGKSGEEFLNEILNMHPDTAVIMVTAVNDAHMAIGCMKRGAYDYLTKPFNLDEVFLSVERAIEKRRLILENRDYQDNLEQKVAAQAQKIKDSFLNSIKALAYALEAKDDYTSGHSQRVGDMAAVIAREMELSLEEQERVKLAGLIHDIGKIGIQGTVLNKEGCLTDDEYEEMKKHCQMGERILSPVMDDKELMKMVRNHHERYDGKGYPDGIAGQTITTGAAILSVCDAFDAMTSERSYRSSMEIDHAFREIECCSGTQFNPDVVSAFLKAKASFIPLIKKDSGVGDGSAK